MKMQKQQRNARGMTYVSVIVSAILVGLVLASYLRLVASQNQNTMRSQAWNRTVAVIEAGIEEALSHLNKNAAPDISGSFAAINLATDGWTPTGGGWTKSNSLGDDYYVVTIAAFAPGNTNPNIVTEGYVKQVPAFASLTKYTPWLAQVSLNTSRGGYVKRQVVCTTTNVPTFSKGLVAKDTIDLKGFGVTTDSYDSSKPGVASDASGRYDITKRRANGDIASNRGVTNSTISPVSVGNAKVYGRVSTGPNINNPGVALIDLGSQGKVGDIAWHNDPTTAGRIKPGWSKDDMNVEFFDVALPSGATDPDRINPATSKKYTDSDGVEYDIWLKSGVWTLQANETFSGKMYVAGNASLIVPKNAAISMSGSSSIIKIAPGGSLKLFVDAQTTKIAGQGVINPNYATNFFYFGTTNNTTLDLGGNAEITGVWYAPNAIVNMNGGGSTDTDFCGAGIFRDIKMNGHFKFHYDESLRTAGLYRGYILTSWNEN